MTVFRVTTRSSNRVDLVTVYASNLGPLHVGMLRDRGDEVIPLRALPALDLPPSCRKVQEAAEDSGLPWHVCVREQNYGQSAVDFTVYGLVQGKPLDGTSFTWHDGRLFTYALPMPLKRALALIKERGTS